MIDQMKWLDRRFVFNLPIGCFPAVLERLRGTPVRAQDLVAHVPDDVLSTRADGGWSVKEQIGHLLDLEPLGERRLADFLARAPVLSAADLENRTTESANHNERQALAIVADLRQQREALVHKLEGLSADQVAATAQHPRLERQLRLIDWAHFVAEHDDHHLARARALLQRRRQP